MANLDNRRITNPVLTNLGKAYMGDQVYPGLNLFPIINVAKEEGTYISLSNEWKLAHSDAQLAVGMGGTPNYIDYDQSTATYKLDEYAVGTKIYKRELAENNPILNLRQLKTRLITNGMALNLEKRIATAAQDDTNYDATNVNTLDGTSGSYYWSDTTNGDPPANIQTGIDAIRTDTGMSPNMMVMAYDAAVLCAKHPKVVALVYPNYTTLPILTPLQALTMLANHFGLTEFHLGMSTYTSTVGGTFSDVWTETCVIAYKDITLTPMAPTFGVTLRKSGYPIVQTEILPESDETEAVIMRDLTQVKFVNADSGYLIENTQA